MLALVLSLSVAGDLDRHQGAWTVVSMVRDEKSSPPGVVGSIRRVVDGDHLVWSRDGKPFAGTRFTLDDSASPARIDLIPDGGPQRDKHVLGIYRFEGDDLVICVADPDRPRPTAFEAKVGDKQTLQRFRKVGAK